jgi:hypothetical protein
MKRGYQQDQVQECLLQEILQFMKCVNFLCSVSYIYMNDSTEDLVIS